jgi:hypothetical protein
MRWAGSLGNLVTQGRRKVKRASLASSFGAIPGQDTPASGTVTLDASFESGNHPRAPAGVG